MNFETAKKAAEIVKEIEELSRYQMLLGNDTLHFELCKHYSDGNQEKVVLAPKYTSRLISAMKEIIEELEKELSTL